jgi:hypothetical protein
MEFVFQGGKTARGAGGMFWPTAQEAVKESPTLEVAAGLPRHIFWVFRTVMAG